MSSKNTFLIFYSDMSQDIPVRPTLNSAQITYQMRVFGKYLRLPTHSAIILIEIIAKLFFENYRDTAAICK